MDPLAEIDTSEVDGLVARFYAQIPNDPILGPMYPKDDLVGAEERLRDFLIYRFGGPATYLEKRGHPRLRMRHAPFAIDEKARDRWLELMDNAMAESRWNDKQRAMIREFFEMVANHMQNRR